MNLDLTVGVLTAKNGWSTWNHQGVGIANHRGRKTEFMVVAWHSIHSPPLYPLGRFACCDSHAVLSPIDS
jgi:hypothetical protein